MRRLSIFRATDQTSAVLRFYFYRTKKVIQLILGETASKYKLQGQQQHLSLLKSSLGCRDGAVVRALASHQCGPGSIPRLGVICGLSLLVLYAAARGFSPGTPVILSPQKPTFDLICFNLLISIYSVPN